MERLMFRDLKVSERTGYVKSVRSNKIFGWASFKSPDRYKEIVLPSAFQKWLPEFMKHPVMTLGHEIDASKVLPCGDFQKVVIREDGLEVEGELMREHPQHVETKAAAKRGLLAWSIQFLGHDSREPNDAEVQEHGKAVDLVLTEVELASIGLVTVGANRDTLAIMKSLALESHKRDVSNVEFAKILGDIQAIRKVAKLSGKDLHNEVEDKINEILQAANIFTEALTVKLTEILAMVPAGDQPDNADDDEGNEDGDEEEAGEGESAESTESANGLTKSIKQGSEALRELLVPIKTGVSN